MYKQRKNFSFLDFPSLTDKKGEVVTAKTSFLRESLNIDSLNSLYQNKEVDKTKIQQPTNVSTTPDVDLKFKTLENPTDTEAQLKKAYDDTLVMGISKPYKIVFTDLQQQQPNSSQILNLNNTMSEEVKVLDDEVLVPLDTEKDKIKSEDNELEKIKPDESGEEDSKDTKSNKDDMDYNFLVILPDSEILPKELIDIVNKAGQGVISSPVLKHMTELPVASLGKDNIKSIEDDIQGYSVAGMNGDIAIKLMNSNKK